MRRKESKKMFSLILFLSLFSTDVKGKATTLQAGTGPESSRRLRFPDFKTIGT
jgi:hypothetical protein